MIKLTKENSFLFEEIRTFSKFEAYIWLMNNAGKDNINKRFIGGVLYKYEYGSLIFQIKELAYIFRWSENNIKMFLTLLESEGLVKKYSNNRYITIELIELIEVENKPKELTENKKEVEVKAVETKVIADEDIYISIKGIDMTITQFDKLINLGYTKEQIDLILSELNNYNKHNYKNLYLTCRNWLKNKYPAEIKKDWNILYLQLRSYINAELGKNLKGDNNSEREFTQRLSEGYTLDDFKKAINVLKDNKFFIETGYVHITLEYITRKNVIEKYSNQLTDESKLTEMMTHSLISQRFEINESIE